MNSVVIYYVMFVTYVEKTKTNSFMKLVNKFVVTSDCVSKVMREFAKKRKTLQQKLENDGHKM